MTNRKDKKAVKEPNFFIVGAPKCGTTSLAEYLGQHPEIFMSPVKEPFYYMSDASIEYDEYISLFQNAGDVKVIGEASTSYLFDEQSPVLIKESHPDAKIVIILRNPVKMVFSYWRYNLIAGSESKSFEEAISNEEMQYRKSGQFKKKCFGWWGHYLYLERALYYEQVKRYFDMFGRKNVRVYIFERFVRKPEAICKDIFDFLGVDPNFMPDCTKVINEGGEVRSRLIRWINNRRHPLLRAFFSPTTRARIRTSLRNFNIKKGKRNELPQTDYDRLKAFFKNDMTKLEGLLDCKIEEWK